MNFREDEALFAKALKAETDRRYNELMQNTIVSGEASEEHHKRIRTMIKLAEKEDKARPNIKKRLIALLIAAVILSGQVNFFVMTCDQTNRYSHD